MNSPLTLSFDEIAPPPQRVYGNLGVPSGATVPDHVVALYVTAYERFVATVDARGVVEPITKEAFEAVYQGEGRNEPVTPVAQIAPQADELALFAVTLGPGVSADIQSLFDANDPAGASMLDAIASVAADQAAAVVQQRWEDALRQRRPTPAAGTPKNNGHLSVLRYSPGYCGWHISGQRRLFEFLRPERIGVSLRPSFLMEPLKSVSGVLIGGAKEIHDFDDAYSFCSDCTTRGCRDRIRALSDDHDGVHG